MGRWTFGPEVIRIMAIVLAIVLCWLISIPVRILRIRAVKRQREWDNVNDTQPSEMLPPDPHADDKYRNPQL